MLAQHLVAAGEHAGAVGYFEIAGDHAGAAYANSEAISSFPIRFGGFAPRPRRAGRGSNGRGCAAAAQLLAKPRRAGPGGTRGGHPAAGPERRRSARLST